MKHRPWSVNSGCVHWEYPDGYAMTPYRGNKFLEI
jgi:hypothetical protein